MGIHPELIQRACPTTDSCLGSEQMSRVDLLAPTLAMERWVWARMLSFRTGFVKINPVGSWYD